MENVNKISDSQKIAIKNEIIKDNQHSENKKFQNFENLILKINLAKSSKNFSRK